MGAIDEYLSAIGRSIATFGDGLAVTFSYMFRKPITIQYPDRTEKPLVTMLPERSRGVLEVDIDMCTGCSLCAKTCPIDCIHIDFVKDKETKQRSLTRFDIDIGKCMFCGLCVDACPASGLRHSHEFEAAMGHPERLMLKFVKEPRPVAKKGQIGDKKPLGSIVRPLLADPWAKMPPSQGGAV